MGSRFQRPFLWIQAQQKHIRRHIIHWESLEGQWEQLPMGDRGRHKKLLGHDPAPEAHQGGEEKGSRQENPRFTLEIPACRGDAQGTVCRNPDRHTPGWHRYTSYKVANFLVEFSTSIPRTQLQPGYGDGFLGAPLQTGRPPESRTSQPRGGRRGASSTHPNPGDSSHV